MSRRRKNTLFLVALGVLVVPGCLGAPDGEEASEPSESAVTATTNDFQNGVAPTSSYAGATDTSLRENAPTTTDGSGPLLSADADSPPGTGKNTNGLLRFDLRSIPVGSTVSSVTFTVNVTNRTSGAGYALYPLSRAWSESQATWLSASSGSAWASAGARGTTDRSATAIGTLTPAVTGKTPVALNAAGIAAVQAWVNAPTANFGFIVHSDDNADGLGFDSSNAATAANRPELTVTFTPPAPSGTGTGLKGDYFKGTSFDSFVVSRTDPTVDFNWGSGAPATGMPVDGFSVRWTGQILPQYSEAYTFFTSSDDGVRLKVNGQVVVANWSNHGVTENSGVIALTAGTKYDVELEYYDNTGAAISRLSWSSKSVAKAIVPRTQLFPAISNTGTCDAQKAARSALVPTTYRPGATTTGPVPCVALKRHDGDLTIRAANTVIEGLDIYGSVILGSTASNVTIRNSILRGPVSTDNDGTFLGGGPGVYNRLGLVIEDSTFDLSGRENWFRDAIAGGRFTLRRTEIKRGVDGVGLVSPEGNVTIEASWIHDGAYFAWTSATPEPKPSHSDMKTHNDGVQFHRGKNYVLRGNFIGGASGATASTGDDYNNACLMISQAVDSSAANRLDGVLIEKNWFQGGAASLNLAYSYGNDLSGVTILNNRFLSNTGYYILLHPGVNPTLSGNVFDATGAPVTITRK